MQGKSSAGKPQQGSTELYPEAHPRHGAITTLPIRATKALPRGASCRARRRCRRALPRRSCARAWLSSCGSWHRRGRRGGRPTGIKNRRRKSINPPRLTPAASQVPTGLGFPSCLLWEEELKRELATTAEISPSRDLWQILGSKNKY